MIHKSSAPSQHWQNKIYLRDIEFFFFFTASQINITKKDERKGKVSNSLECLARVSSDAAIRMP